MVKKTLLSITLLVIIAMSLVLVSRASAVGSATGIITAVKSGTTDVSNWKVGSNPDPNGTEIVVDLYVSGASNVWSLKTDITWNVSLLNLTSITEGIFLKKNPTANTLFVGSDETTWKINDDGFGYVSGGISSTRLSASKTNNAAGVFATLKFTVLDYDQANITLSDGLLTDVSEEVSSANTISASILIDNPSAPAPEHIDVSTNKGGVGESIRSGTYGPQEAVDTCALVTYNSAPVANIEVAFNVLYSNGTLFTLKTATTDSTGYASTNFRLPWPDTNNPEALFGNWSITATASISQTVISDSTIFAYNYIINTGDVQLPATISRQEVLPINIIIYRMAELPIWSTVIITVYDEIKTPIGSFVAYNDNADAWLNEIPASITIPADALVGQATVYINVLTDSNGTPYCPEKAFNIQILP